MPSARDSSHPWHESGRSSQGQPADRDELMAPSTQIVGDHEDYLGQGQRDVGRRISDDQVELFVVSDAAHALQQQFTLHRPEFLVLHDVGISASLRLLAGLAMAAGARVQSLSVRRQGHGVALASLQFVEVTLADKSVVRVYSTDINSDNQTRTQLSKVLLGFSRLGVLMIGAMPPHALTAHLTPLHEALSRGPWHNRDLLMVPVGSSTALAAQAQQLCHGSQVAVHVTPQAGKPRQAWNYIGGAWNRLHGKPGGERALPTEIEQAVSKPRVPVTEAATLPMPLDLLTRTFPSPSPSPSSPPSRPLVPPSSLPSALQPRPVPTAMPTPSVELKLPAMPTPGGTRWSAYVERCAQIKGVIACCVFDMHTVKSLAEAGGPPQGERLAQQGASLLLAMNEAARALGLGPARAEAAISTTNHHLLLRPVPGHPGVALHMVMSASSGNLMLIRMQVERIESPK